MKTVFIATKNPGKVRDFEKLFASYGINVQSLLDQEVNLPDVEETGQTFEENAALKAETIASSLKIPVLADDSGLEVDALNGRPGIYSARYAGEEKNDQLNIGKLLEELKGIPAAKRTARFVCVIALAIPGEETLLKRGSCEGRIAEVPNGSNGFGYDSVFYPEGKERTMAQLSAEEKNQISHRHHALIKLDSWLKEL